MGSHRRPLGLLLVLRVRQAGVVRLRQKQEGTKKRLPESFCVIAAVPGLRTTHGFLSLEQASSTRGSILKISGVATIRCEGYRAFGRKVCSTWGVFVIVVATKGAGCCTLKYECTAANSKHLLAMLRTL